MLDRLGDQADEREQRLGVREHVAVVVDQHDRLAVGADARHRDGCPRRRTSSPNRRPCSSRIRGRALRGRRVRVHREDLGAELREHVRHHDRRGTRRVVEHDLEAVVRGGDRRRPRPRVPRCRTRSTAAGTRCRRCRPRTPAGSPRETAGARCLRCVPSSMSRPSASKKRISTLSGSSGASRTVIPPAGRSVADLEPGQRHRGELDVLDVRTCQVEPGDHRALQCPGDPARVAARGDHRSALQRGAVRHRDPDGDLGRDVDVRQATDAAPPEQRPRGAALPDDRRVDDGVGLDGLERVDLHAGVHDGVLPDEALVADDDALVEPGVRRAGRRTARSRCRGGELDRPT